MEHSQTKQRALFSQAFLQKDVGDIADRAAELFNIFHSLPQYNQKDLKGGVLVLVPDETCASCFSVTIGEVPNNDPTKYCKIAMSKCAVLRNAKRARSSYALRDESCGIYGGGISFRHKWETDFHVYTFSGKAYLAFSGLPELADEALVLVLAIDMGWTTEKKAKKIVQASANPYFEPLLEAVK